MFAMLKEICMFNVVLLWIAALKEILHFSNEIAWNTIVQNINEFIR